MALGKLKFSMNNRVDLYDKIISLPNLFEAWKEIKFKNSAGGIDKETIESFNADLDDKLHKLHLLLKENNYRPEPYLRVSIPKNDTEYRKLGLLTITDKIVQQAIRRQIENKFEHLFLDNSYAYRPGKGAVKAVRRLQHILTHQKPGFFISCDIDNFFDSVPHNALWQKLTNFLGNERVVSLVRLCLTIGSVSQNYKWNDTKAGIPQGAILSPLMSNFYLHAFDQAVCSRTKNYIRYADDFVVLAQSGEEAKELASFISSFLTQRLQLNLNEIPAITPAIDGVTFLGLSVSVNGLALTAKKQKKIEDKIAAVAIDSSSKSLSDKSIEILQGIEKYYGRLLSEADLQRIDEKIIDKIKNLLALNRLVTQKAIKTVLGRTVFFSKEYTGSHTGLAESLYEQLNQKRKQRKSNDKVAEIIQQKKNEYQKREAAGMELVIHQFGCFLGVNQRGLTIKIKGVNVNENITSSLRHITIIGNGISISTDAIKFCAEKNITIDLFDNKGQHYAGISPPADLDAGLLLKQSEATVSEKGFHIARQLIYSKISNQLNLLKYFSKYHKHIDPDYFAALTGNMEKFKEIKEKTAAMVYEPDFQEKLIATESQAAIIYWGLVKNLIDDDIAFEGRERHGARDIVNSMLNYGYALLYARIWQAILIAKLHPNISFIHARQPGKPTLVYDIIEMFRAQCVDRIIISLIQKKEPLTMKDGFLTEDTRKLLIANIWERLNRHELYRGKRIKQIEIISEQCRDIVKYLNGQTKTFKPYIAKW